MSVYRNLEQDTTFRIMLLVDESSSVDTVTVDDWIQRIPKLVHKYDAKDIFNCNETGLFFKSLPGKSLTLEKEECKGGKKSKERCTILLCSYSAVEGKLKPPLVIGKYTNFKIP